LTGAEILDALAGLLVVGLAYAAIRDWIEREVRDGVWQALAVLGTVGGIAYLLAEGEGSPLALGLWVLASAFVLQHLFPWDVALERRSEAAPALVEISIYAATIAVVGAFSIVRGVGPGAVPVPVIAVVASVLLARALFEIGILYGGADAKALMVAGLLVPMWTTPLFALPAGALAAVEFYPYALTLLMNAAILSAGVPLALALWNARRGTFEFPRGFTGYPIPVARLSSSFVWVKDPLLSPEAEEADTTEADIALRKRQQAELEAQGVSTVWVTPQLPFVLPLLAGAVVGLLAGNLVFDLVALL
jgi:prepilin signal peptidase PulO-like enzyme (type II secretory pathway)